MRKIDIMYTNLIELISQITYEGPDFTAYHDSKIEAVQNRLMDIADLILIEKREINKAKMRLEFYSDFTSLLSHLDDFKNSFDDFPSFRKNEIYGIITIIQKLTVEYGGTAINLEENIDENDFGLIPLTHDINKDNFFAFDISNYRHSIFLFNLSKKQDFKNYVENIASGSQILFYLLTKIGVVSNPLPTGKFILVDSNFIISPKVVWATLCLHIVKAGETIHKTYEYTLAPQHSTSSVITLGNTYQQFEDSLDIISEYNYQKDILDKYLRIYHVLENFMYKSPLVSLERQANGEVFSIRDFKRMYDKIKDSEINMLKKLFEDIFIMDYSPGMPFSSKIFAGWSNLFPTHVSNETNLNLLIQKLSITNNSGNDFTYASVTITNLINFFPRLIYSFRNSMVHNRETEFHLTHLNLMSHPVMADTAKIILENFLIPTLEEIVFHLICRPNNVVWYDQSTLNLWDEN